MKPLQNNRRKFLAFIGVTASSVGVTFKSFGFSPTNESVLKKSGNDGNVRQFDAKGDGKADDSAAVQAAIDAGSGSVYFPKGVYRITKTIELNLDRIGYSSIRSEGSAQIIMGGRGLHSNLLEPTLNPPTPGIIQRIFGHGSACPSLITWRSWGTTLRP